MTAHRERLAAWLMRSGGQDWTTCAERLERAIEAAMDHSCRRPLYEVGITDGAWLAFWAAMDDA
jgi:hypothetical protein